MTTRRLLTAAAFALLVSPALYAQEVVKGDLKSYSFVEAQGGAQFTSTNAKIDKLITPNVALSFGHYFTPVVGARLHVSGWESKGGFSAIDQYYKWKNINTDADLLINLTNIFSKRYDHFLNLIFVGGVGLDYSWDNDELKSLMTNYNGLNTQLAWDDNRLVHNVRAGLRLETNVTKPFGVSLEVQANNRDDRFNSKVNNSDDWNFSAMLGVSFRFGHKYKKVVKPAPEPQPEPTPVPVPVPVKKKEPAPQPVVKYIEQNVNEEMHYVIRGSDLGGGANDKLAAVAQFMKDCPDAKVTLTGYADRGTGNPKVNMRYSQQRVQKVRDALVNQYGVDPSRLVVEAKGDTVQPFPNNDDNRAVIIEGKGTKKVVVNQ